MTHKPHIILTAAALMIIAALLLTGTAAGLPGQLDPTAQQQTVDAIVFGYFTQTARAQQQIAATQTIQAAFNQALTATAARAALDQTATAAINQTIQAAFNQALTATADFNATVSARMAELRRTEIAATLSAGGSVMVARNADWTPQIETFDGVQMVLVPPGCFRMGSTDAQIDAAMALYRQQTGNTAQREWFNDEQPVHEVCFDHPFWIDRYEVTNGQFARFGGRAANASYWTDADRPRERITWFEARDFCALRGARLPTEAEWEYAARGPDGLVYPWGNTFVAENVVYEQNSGRQTANVGSRPGGASWAGALDLSGNVWEWAADWYDSAYYSASPRLNPQGPASGRWRVGRGGSWYADVSFVRAASRLIYVPDDWNDLIGFRCARSY